MVLDYKPSSLNAATQGDPTLISMLLRNLLDNAARDTPGNGRIRIFLEANRLTVENSAAGLPEACASRLGERFFRPPGQEYPGSGLLGLSIVKRIAEIHRLRLTVQMREEASDKAESCFRVVLNFAG